MKNILIISSSPRWGGNSDTLCDQFLQGASDAGHRVEKIFLNEKNIGFCKGCGACFDSGRCSQRDDMAGILDKLLAADVIVFGTPVYFYGMNGQMKTFLDRTCPVYTQLKNREFYFLLAAHDENADHLHRVMEGFRGFSQECLENAREAGIVYGTGAWMPGDIVTTSAYHEAYRMGKLV